MRHKSSEVVAKCKRNLNFFLTAVAAVHFRYGSDVVTIFARNKCKAEKGGDVDLKAREAAFELHSTVDGYVQFVPIEISNE
jgi:hypothetical protein